MYRGAANSPYPGAVMIRPLLLASAALFVAPPAFADTTPKTGGDSTTGNAAPATSDATDADASPQSDQDHNIIVTAPIRTSEADVLHGTSVVSGAELTRNMQPTIGETLAKQPGVSASSFGPSASRPILRGFQGERVRIM